jgi:hypothetical protein
MSLNTLNELQNQATALRRTSEKLEGYAKVVAKKRDWAIHNSRPLHDVFQVKTSGDDWNYHRPQTEAIETEFQKAIAPFEDHILAIMEINFRTEAKKAMMRAEAIEARIAASITLPEPLP